MTTPDPTIDAAIMSIVEAYSAMPRGNTIGADSFPEARSLLTKMMEAREHALLAAIRADLRSRGWTPSNIMQMLSKYEEQL